MLQPTLLLIIVCILQFQINVKTPLKSHSDILLENLKLSMPPKKPAQKKAANGYKMPDPIPAGKS